MDRDLLMLGGVTALVGAISAVIAYARADRMTAAADLAARGLPAARRSNTLFFGLLIPALVAVLSRLVYRSMTARLGDDAQAAFLALASGVALLLSALAVVLFKRRGVAEMCAMHLAHAVGFGWLMPLLLGR